MITTRLILILVIAVAAGLAIAPAFAGPLTLRAEVSVASDVLTLGDLVEGVTGEAAARPLFRAPGLGERGTIQARRIVDAAAQFGLGRIETQGRGEVKIERAAREIRAAEIEAAVKRALARQFGLDVSTLAITFDAAPEIVLPAEIDTEALAEDLTYDRRSRRVAALVKVGTEAGRGRSLKVAGSLVETVEVALLNRALARGETVGAADVTFERRLKEAAPADAASDAIPLTGRVARRALASGMILRNADLVRPELVGRGDTVLIVYEVPGITLTLRGKSNEAGALGDVIAVVNTQSKKVLQGTVTGSGTVTVKAGLIGRVASAQP